MPTSAKATVPNVAGETESRIRRDPRSQRGDAGSVSADRRGRPIDGFRSDRRRDGDGKRAGRADAAPTLGAPDAPLCCRELRRHARGSRRERAFRARERRLHRRDRARARTTSSRRIGARCSSTSFRPCPCRNNRSCCACFKRKWCGASEAARRRRWTSGSSPRRTPSPRKLSTKENCRADLYYRLSVFVLRVPPLRERSGDVILLAERFARQHAEARGETPKRLETRGCARRWPGIPGREMCAS